MSGVRRSLRKRGFVARAASALALTAAMATASAQESRPRGSDLESALREISQLVSSRRFADAWKRTPELRGALSGAGVSDELRTRGEKLILAAGIEVVGAAAGFKGTVAALERDIVEVVYEPPEGFDADFELLPILPSAREPKREGRSVRGTGALAHRAIWGPSVHLELVGRPAAPSDFGPVLIDPDETATERFLTGFHNNAYFGVKYDADRSVSAGHVFLLAGRGASSRARTRPTQLLGRSAIPAIARGDEVRCTLSVQGARAEFKTGTSPTATITLAFDLLPATQTFPRTRAGVLVRDSAFDVSRLLIRGRLDPKWAAEETARLLAAIRDR